MVLITQSGPETLAIDSQAPDFESLPATDGREYGLTSFKDNRLLVLSFTCNHCPYAQAYEDRFIALANQYQPKGVAFAAINPNDAENYPDDDFENMKKRAEEKAYPFPYMQDETQEVAKAYGAVCTPHIFILGPERTLLYEGRIDDNWKEPDQVKSHDLRDTLEALLAEKPVPQPQTNPLGCSIKWK